MFLLAVYHTARGLKVKYECLKVKQKTSRYTMRLGCCVAKTEIIKDFVESLMHFPLKKITYYNGHFGEIIIEIYVLHCPALLRWE